MVDREDNNEDAGRPPAHVLAEDATVAPGRSIDDFGVWQFIGSAPVDLAAVIVQWSPSIAGFGELQIGYGLPANETIAATVDLRSLMEVPSGSGGIGPLDVTIPNGERLSARLRADDEIVLQLHGIERP